MENMNELSEIEYVTSCLEHVNKAVDDLTAVPNDIWNSCINSNYLWSADLIRSYLALKDVQVSMTSYLNEIQIIDESKKE